MPSTDSLAPRTSLRRGVPSPDVLARRRLGRLLETRARLAVLAAERSSHGVDDAGETLTLVFTVESEILAEFPDVHDEQFRSWLVQDAAAEHPLGVLTPSCAICRSLARDRGLNLEPLEAA
jgi:hypothetical protein